VTDRLLVPLCTRLLPSGHETETTIAGADADKRETPYPLI
jgi:hypothetical protein